MGIFDSFGTDVEDEDAIASVLGLITEDDLKTEEVNRAERGEYGELAIEFLFAKPPKKIIEVELKDGPFKGRQPQAVAQGFRNAFTKAKIKEDRAVVMTRTNAEGKTAVYLINVKACRP